MYDKYDNLEQGAVSRWWDKAKYSKSEVCRGVVKAVRLIDDAQKDREESFDRYLRLYSRKVANTYKGNKFVTDYDDDRVRWNVVRAVVEALVANISTHRVRPYFQTFRGNYKMKQQARNLNRFVHGQFTRGKVYEKMSIAFKNATIFGTAGIHIYESGNGQDKIDICCEVVYPGELIVDDQESRDGEPRSLYRHKRVHRSELQAMLDLEGITSFDARDAKLLRDAFDAGENANGPLDESVSIVEAWHLPSGPDAKDGRHSIVCTEGTIIDEDWEEDSFPVKILRYQHPPVGFWGVGVTENLLGIQAEITYILQKIQKLMTLMTTMWWVQKGSGVSKISNADAAVREYSGRPPIHQTTPSISAEYFNHLDRLWQSAFENEGVSQLQATGLKPAGLNSGEAQRVYANQVSARFRHTQMGYEQFGLDIAEGMLDVARRIIEREDGAADIKVLCAGDKYCEEISFKDCCLDKNKYVMRVYPTGFLPEEPSGRVEKLQELTQINPTLQRFATLAFTDVPDVEAMVGPVNAPIEIVQRHIYKILENGEAVTPLPMQDLELTVLMSNNAILEAEEDGTPDNRLELLRQYLVKAQEMLDMSRPQPSMPQPMPDPAAQSAMPVDPQMMPPPAPSGPIQ